MQKLLVFVCSADGMTRPSGEAILVAVSDFQLKSPAHTS